MGGFAWVTLATNDSYSLGALVLAHSLKQSSTKHQLAVLVTPGVTKSMRVKLGSVFDVVQEVNILDSKDESNLRLLKRPELGVTFTKLHCWRLTQFEKCVFLDADTLVLKNCDELFERDEFSAAPDVGWPDCFNSGVFVYRPSVETYDKLVQFALEKGSFDGGDQGLLNLYFNDWAHKDISKHLPFIYNMCSTACYSYLPAFKQYGSNVKIVHFISSTKPWLQYFDTESRQVQPAGDMLHLKSVLQCWWDIFCSLIHPNLTSDMAGLAGAFAQFTLGAPRSPTQTALEDHLRRQGWEVGNIDYMGRDAFDNIWSKICETLSTGTQKAAEPTTTGDVQKSESVVETAVQVTEIPAVEAKLSEEKTEIKPVETPVVVAEKQQPQPVDQKPTEIEAKIESSVIAQEAKPVDVPKSTEEVKKTEAESQTVEVKSTEVPKPVEGLDILVTPQSIEDVKPVETKPAEETKPETPIVQAETPKPVGETKPEALPEEKSPKATEEVKPVETEKPVKEDKPEVQQSECKIKPIVCPKLVEEQKPVGDVKPAEEIKPVEEIKTPEQVKPVEEVKPAEDVKPTEEVKPAEEVKPTEEVKPAEEAKPVEGIKVAEEVKIIDELKPAEEAKPIEEAKPVTEIKPIEEIKFGEAPTDIVKITEEGKAEVVKPVEEIKLEAKPCEEVKPAEKDILAGDLKSEIKEAPITEVKPAEKQGEVKPEEPKKDSEEKPAVDVKSEEPTKVESKPEQAQLKTDSKVPEAVVVAQEPKKSKESKCEKAAQKKEEAKSADVTKVQEKECKAEEACCKKVEESKPAEKKDDIKQEKPKDVKGKDEAAKAEASSAQPAECKKQGKGGKKDKKKQQEVKGECPKGDCPQKECPKSECPKDCPKEKQDCPKKACSKETKPVETPKTPEVIEATPPTSPITTEKPEEKALGVEGTVPSTPPPPAAAAAASGEQQAPTPPPRKSNGGKKAKAKK